MRNLAKNIGILLIGFLFGFVASLFVVRQEFISNIQNSETPSPSNYAGAVDSIEEPVFVSLTVDFGDGRIIACNNQKLVKEQAVFNLLEFCSKSPQNPFDLQYNIHPEFGVFIEQIGDRKSGQDQKYWQYWVNNEYAQIGATQYRLKDGDVVEWKFTQGQF